ncbi:MAG: PqiC family protein [Pseudomonadota bacterium]
MKTASIAPVALLLALTLAGCGTTPPNNYYLLSAEVDAQAKAQTPSIGVGPVDIPEYLNRNRLVFQGSGNQLQMSNSERWAEPLTDGIERVLNVNLSSELGTQNTQSFPWSAGQTPDYGLSVRILNLDANAEGARMVAEWEVRHPADGATLVRKVSQMQAGYGGEGFSANAAAAAYSELLRQLSSEAAAVIRANEAGTS